LIDGVGNGTTERERDAIAHCFNGTGNGKGRQLEGVWEALKTADMFEGFAGLPSHILQSGGRVRGDAGLDSATRTDGRGIVDGREDFARDIEAEARASSKGDAAQTILDAAAPSVIIELGVDSVAGDDRERRIRDVFHDEPGRLRLKDAAFEFWYQVFSQGIAVVLDKVTKAAEALAGRAADDSTEETGERMEAMDITTPQEIRTAHDHKALFFECSIEQTNTGKEREDGEGRRGGGYQV